MYDSDNNLIPDADTYFWELDKNGYLEDADSISKDLDKHLSNNWHSVESSSSKYSYQSGFGGNNGDGLVDFFLENKMPCPKDMKFKVYNKNYTMKFRYN